MYFLLKKHPLLSDRQYPSYGDCLEVKREYYQNCSVLDCVTQCSQSAAELYYCNMVEWFWWDWSLILTTNRFLQCFDTVGLVIRPVSRPEMTNNVLSGTLSNWLLQKSISSKFTTASRITWSSTKQIAAVCECEVIYLLLENYEYVYFKHFILFDVTLITYYQAFVTAIVTFEYYNSELCF